LLPGYLFVKFDLTHYPWRAINSTFGVKRLVGVRDSIPYPMPEGVVSEIMARCKNGIIMQLSERFKLGQQVSVTHGPLANVMGLFQGMDGKGRVAVLMNILGHEVSVKMRSDSILPVV
jgi:transcriptional antiterminator RfaH